MKISETFSNPAEMPDIAAFLQAAHDAGLDEDDTDVTFSVRTFTSDSDLRMEITVEGKVL